jgi:hypothetical protein
MRYSIVHLHVAYRVRTLSGSWKWWCQTIPLTIFGPEILERTAKTCVH